MIKTVPHNWHTVKFNKMFDRLQTRNSVGNTNVLTISAQYGLISQQKFFNKSVASEDLSNYYLLRNGDFAYNKSYSGGYNFGAFKRLTDFESGVVSPLYICFSPSKENEYPEFYTHYFESCLLDREIKVFAQEGARNHGLLNIGIDDFFSMQIPLPPLPEQRAIAEVLTTADRLIAGKVRLIAAKQKQKRWLMQNLLTGKMRLPGFGGEWESVRLGEIGECYSGLSGKNADDFESGSANYITFLNVLTNTIIDTSIFKNVNVSDCEHQNAVRYGDLFFNTSSENPEEVGMCAVLLSEQDNTYLNSFCFGFRMLTDTINPLYLVYFFNGLNGRKAMFTLAQGVTRYNLSKSAFIKIKLSIPPLAEQTAIAENLTMADREIELLNHELEQQQQVKKYLMQQLLTGRIRVGGAAV